MAKKYVLLALTLILVQLLIGGLLVYSQQYKECSVVLGDKPVSIIYEAPKALEVNKLVLTMQGLKYSLPKNSYFIVMVGSAPSDLYGFAVMVCDNDVEYYLIRGSQNEWFKINTSIENNVSVIAKLIDDYVNVSIYVNDTLVLSLKRNATSISLKTLILSLGNIADMNAFAGNVYFKSLCINVDGREIFNFTNANDTYVFLVEKTSITPSSDRVRLLCNYIKHTTITITKTYVTTTVVTGTTTSTTTSTITITSTSVIPITKIVTIYKNITKVVNKTLTPTVTSVVDKSMVLENIPWHILTVTIAFAIAVVISLIIVILRR